MKKFAIALSAGMIAAASLPALADPGNGKGNGNGGGPVAAAMQKGKGNKGNGKDKGQKQIREQAQKFEKSAKKAENNARQYANQDWDKKRDKDWGRQKRNDGNYGGGIVDRVVNRSTNDRDWRDDDRWRDRNDWKRPEKRDYRDNPFEIANRDRSFGYREASRYRYYDGCPPGLAKKNNGCLPPGQAKKYYDNYWDRYGRWDDGNRRYYRDGYLLSYNRSGNLLGYLPLLGGALSVGSLFPTNYASYPVSDYRARYYGRNDDYVYRYSDGVIYALDPDSYAISQVAGLLTGDDFTIGQPIPAGYSVYNVPYGYRDRYVDGPNAYYRYNDGYVYRVDPTTQLIQAAIQLLS